MISKKGLQVSTTILAGVFLLGAFIDRFALLLPHKINAAWIYTCAHLTGWFMQLFGMLVWVEHDTLHTDLHSYPLLVDNQTLPLSLGIICLAIAIALWRHYRPSETILLLLAALSAVVTWNTIRLAMLIRVGPAPDTGTLTGLLNDTTGILAAIHALTLGIIIIAIESARLRRQYRNAPLPGTESGALSEIPPFWHRVLRRYRNAYLLLPVLAVIAGILYAGRPARRIGILTELVEDMSAQGNYALALRLGQHLASQKPDNINWQLRLIRIMTLAAKTDQALAALDAIPLTATRDHADAINLLYTYNHIRNLDIPKARQTLQQLQQQPRTDPIWHVIFMELALAMQDQKALLHHIPDAVLAFTQQERLLPVIPIVAASGRWDLFLITTQWLDPLNTPVAIQLHQIMAEMERGNLGNAAAKTRFALQQNHQDTLSLVPLLILLRTNPTGWEPLFSQWIINLSNLSSDPDILCAAISAAFAADRPDLAWHAYRRLQHLHPDCLHAALAHATHAQQWFRIRNHVLQLPANTPAETTHLLPLIALGKHLPFFQDTLLRIPHTTQLEELLQDPETQYALIRTQAIERSRQEPATLAKHPQLRLQYAALLESVNQTEEAVQQYAILAREHPAMTAIATHNRVRILQENGKHWQAYHTLRQILENPDQHAQQLPLLVQLIESLWETRQYVTATFAAREAVKRFPEDPTLRTMLADILLQQQNAAQALHILQNTTIRRSDVTDRLEAEALRQTGRYAALQTFNRQRLRLPTPTPPDNMQAERLPPAENLLAPIAPHEISLTQPAPESPWFTLMENAAAQSNATADITTWLQTAETPLEKAELMHTLASIMLQQGNQEAAREAALQAVHANPNDPALWLMLLRSAPNPNETIAPARAACPNDPDLWLAELVLVAHAVVAEKMPPEHIQHLLDETLLPGNEFPVDTLVRAADFLWRGDFRDAATILIEQYRGRERSLLAAHLLALEAAEYAGKRGQVLQQIEAAIAAAGQAAPELFARFIKSKLRFGQIEFDGNVVNALRQLRQAEPENTFWAELLGYIRYMRGGADMLEAGLEMQHAIRAGSTNLTAFLVAAEGFRKVNRPADAAAILRQGLELHPDDPVLLNNLAYILAEIPESAHEALQIIKPLRNLAEENPEIRDTLAFVLLRNNELDAARQLLAKSIQEASPDSRIWFRSHLHLAEIVWRQGRHQIAASMLEQLLHGARNIPDEDVLNANRLLVQIRTASPEP